MPLATTTCNAVFTVSLGMAKCHISTLTNAVCMQNSVVDMVPAALAYLHLLLYEITYQTPSMRGRSLVLCISFQYSSIIFLFMWITHVLPILYCVIFLPYIIYILPIFPCVILVWEHVAYPPILPCVILWNTSKQIHRLPPALHGCYMVNVHRTLVTTFHGNTYTLLFKTIRDDGKNNLLQT